MSNEEVRFLSSVDAVVYEKKDIKLMWVAADQQFVCVFSEKEWQGSTAVSLYRCHVVGGQVPVIVPGNKYYFNGLSTPMGGLEGVESYWMSPVTGDKGKVLNFTAVRSGAYVSVVGF